MREYGYSEAENDCEQHEWVDDIANCLPQCWRFRDDCRDSHFRLYQVQEPTGKANPNCFRRSRGPNRQRIAGLDFRVSLSVNQHLCRSSGGIYQGHGMCGIAKSRRFYFDLAYIRWNFNFQVNDEAFVFLGILNFRDLVLEWLLWHTVRMRFIAS